MSGPVVCPAAYRVSRGVSWHRIFGKNVACTLLIKAGKIQAEKDGLCDSQCLTDATEPQNVRKTLRIKDFVPLSPYFPFFEEVCRPFDRASVAVVSKSCAKVPHCSGNTGLSRGFNRLLIGIG